MHQPPHTADAALAPQPLPSDPADAGDTGPALPPLPLPRAAQGRMLMGLLVALETLAAAPVPPNARKVSLQGL